MIIDSARGGKYNLRFYFAHLAVFVHCCPSAIQGHRPESATQIL